MILLTFDDFPKDIVEALKRAKAWQKYVDNLDTLFITSRNKEEPLTNVEKMRIATYLVEEKHLYRRVFFDHFVAFIDEIDEDINWNGRR